MWFRRKCLNLGINILFMAFCTVLVLGCEKNSGSSSQHTATTSNDSAEMDENPSVSGSKTAAEADELSFELVESIKFADGTEVKSIAKADIEALRDRPIHMGGNDADGVTLTNEKDEKIHVRTCREYDAALERGYFPSTTFDISMASWFNIPCGTLNLLQTAAIPQQSFISNPKAGITDLELLPVTFFPELFDFDQNVENVTYQDQVETEMLKVSDMGENWLRCENEGLKQYLKEVARADFNSDGIEDILLSEYVSATRGSYRDYKISILTRKSADGKFEKVPSHHH